MAGDDRPPRLRAASREILLDLDRRAHPVEDPQQADAGRVEADLLEPHAASGHDRRGDQRGRRRTRSRRAPRSAPAPGARPGARRSAGPGRCAPPARLRSSVTSTSAPAAASMRSVWSRVVAPARPRGSRPSASRPASSRHDLTWALATGSRYVDPRAASRLERAAAAGGRRGTRPRRPSAAAARRPGPPGRRRIDSSPSRVHAPVALPRKPAGEDAKQRPGVLRRRARRARRLGRIAPPGHAARSRAPADRCHRPRSTGRAPRPPPRAPGSRRGSPACRRRRGSPRSPSSPPPSPRSAPRGG